MKYTIIVGILVSMSFLMGCQQEKETTIIAHRGASGYAPDHSMIAYEKAVELNSDFIELDLQITHDDVVVAFHDSNLSKWANDNKTVSDYKFEELEQIDMGKVFNEKNTNYASDELIGQRILSAEEIFKRFSDSVNYYIEIKQPNSGVEESLGDLLEKYDLYNNLNTKVLIQSFHLNSLEYFHKNYPNLETVYLVGNVNYDEVLSSIPAQIDGIGGSYNNLSLENIQKIKSKGLYVHAYTVNEKEIAEQLIEDGIDGIFTNYPDIINK